MEKFYKLLKQYDYRLPAQLIAQSPASPRDSARIMVYNKRGGKINFDTFKNLGRYLPKNAVLVFNQTKVWPARFEVVNPSGGKARLLYIGLDNKLIKALSDRPLNPGTVVGFAPGRMPNRQNGKSINFSVIKKVGQFYYLKPSFPLARLQDILITYGITPLPPYIKHSPLTEKQKRREYQSVFAKSGLSVAAPTASLHFTKRLIGSLMREGIGEAYLRLDVGLGTFAPLKEENIHTRKLHREFYLIDKHTAAFLNAAKKQGRPIIAVGTTAARTLESASTNHGQLTKLSDDTELFISPGYKFKFIDGLITNFHVPKSSLLMLVSALVGRSKLLTLYQQAVAKRFRFFSFGDAMLILPQ
ncbi:MAG: tRNA preQ1(34) S-adenosylmethionine ribosyltransferase-isomerase QueA [Legionella sp.]|uniref:tRNA preQ1(34) S-adenosylmethionine ribosyltransferase-isomerase QueA n=1 Tax=Legionella sp. TaxID=459 RepID=UPI002840074C|nr:tRNA preQ1(34) S-adenosylmethionine ribosyltransferase-isomerase QueA [Legionella sp.]